MIIQNTTYKLLGKVEKTKMKQYVNYTCEFFTVRIKKSGVIKYRRFWWSQKKKNSLHNTKVETNFLQSITENHNNKKIKEKNHNLLMFLEKKKQNKSLCYR